MKTNKNHHAEKVISVTNNNRMEHLEISNMNMKKVIKI